jgi:signal transduction histidine kinase/GAF domain-containing protein
MPGCASTGSQQQTSAPAGADEGHPAWQAAEGTLRAAVDNAHHLLHEMTGAGITFVCIVAPTNDRADLYLATQQALDRALLDLLTSHVARLLREHHGIVLAPGALALFPSTSSPATSPSEPNRLLDRAVTVPLAAWEGRLGLLGCVGWGAGKGEEETQCALSSLAGLVSIALRQVDLVEQARAQLAQCRALCERSTQLSGVLKLGELREMIRRAALDLCPAAEGARVWLLDEDAALTADHLPESAASRRQREWLAPLMAMALSQGETVDCPDLLQPVEGLTMAPHGAYRAIMAAPLAIRDRPIGALSVASSRPAAFDAADRHVLTALARQAAVAIDSAQLYGELRHQKQHMEAVIQHMADGLLVLDRDRRIISLNQAAERMLGLEEAEVLGWSPGQEPCDPRFHVLVDICRLEEASSALPRHPALLDADEPNGQPEVTVSGAVPRILRVLSSPIRSAGDELGGEIKVLHDVTRERELERMQNDFVSTVSHELRTPLFSIKGFVDLILQGKVPDPGTQHEFLTRVLQQADHLAAIVRDLLDTSRLEADTVDLTRTLLDLSDIVREALARLGAVAQSHKMTIELDTPPDLPRVLGDARRLEQVVTNLVDNAIKFSSPGSTVTVRCESDEREVTVHVIDQGIGIPPEAMPRLFTRFYHVDSSATRRVGGTGLGLYICRRILDAHQGRVRVQSRPGEGSTFSFSIPIALQEG